MNEQMTKMQTITEAISLAVKSCIDQDVSLDAISKEAQKELIDAAKELFLHHDEDKALVHAVKLVEVLERRKR